MDARAPVKCKLLAMRLVAVVVLVSATGHAAVLPRPLDASLKRLLRWFLPEKPKGKSASKDAWSFEDKYLRLYKRLFDIHDLRISRPDDKKAKAKLLRQKKRELLVDFEAFLRQIKQYEKTHERLMVDDLTVSRITMWPIPQLERRLQKLRKQSAKAKWDQDDKTAKVSMTAALEQWLPSLRLPEGPDFREAKERMRSWTRRLLRRR